MGFFKKTNKQESKKVTEDKTENEVKRSEIVDLDRLMEIKNQKLNAEEKAKQLRQRQEKEYQEEIASLLHDFLHKMDALGFAKEEVPTRSCFHILGGMWEEGYDSNKHSYIVEKDGLYKYDGGLCGLATREEFENISSTDIYRIDLTWPGDVKVVLVIQLNKNLLKAANKEF